VQDAAELGLPKAQGVMADWCYSGRHEIAKDIAKSIDWAKKAAAGGDRQGQFRLGYAVR
jgi:TPR repeat protein